LEDSKRELLPFEDSKRELFPSAPRLILRRPLEFSCDSATDRASRSWTPSPFSTGCGHSAKSSELDGVKKDLALSASLNFNMGWVETTGMISGDSAKGFSLKSSIIRLEDDSLRELPPCGVDGAGNEETAEFRFIGGDRERLPFPSGWADSRRELLPLDDRNRELLPSAPRLILRRLLELSCGSATDWASLWATSSFSTSCGHSANSPELDGVKKDLALSVSLNFNVGWVETTGMVSGDSAKDFSLRSSIIAVPSSTRGAILATCFYEMYEHGV
jgi:hypothetical protein